MDNVTKAWVMVASALKASGAGRIDTIRTLRTTGLSFYKAKEVVELADAVLAKLADEERTVAIAEHVLSARQWARRAE